VPNAARAAKNESLFREVNEGIRLLEESFELGEEVSFVCECSRLDCTDPVVVTLEEYKAVREGAAWFLVVCGHVDPEYERIVIENDRYAVIEKFGLAGEIAEDEA
jgi:hypothetical protein